MDILAPTKTFPSLLDSNFRLKVPPNSNAIQMTTFSVPKRSIRNKPSSPSISTLSSHCNGHPSPSPASSGDPAGHDVLRRLVRNGELDSALRLLESIFLRGTDPPDIIPCTSLIRGLCRSGRTAAARRVLDIIETSGASPDVITYNVMISGYSKSGETDEALNILHRMSVPPDVVTYNTIFQSLCERGKLHKAFEVLDHMLHRACSPDVFTYTILIEATCKESGVGHAMKLLDEMRAKGCTPDVVTYNVLINGI